MVKTTLDRLTEECRLRAQYGYKGDVLTLAIERIEELEQEHDEMMDKVIQSGSKTMRTKLGGKLFWYRELYK